MSEESKLEVIGKQAIEIRELKEQVSDLENALEDIKSTIVCIGGPLNDNYYQYSPNQLKIFHRILGLCDID